MTSSKQGYYVKGPSMKTKKRIVAIAAFLGLISSLSAFQIEPLFLEKVASIKDNLFKISAPELEAFLGLSLGPIPTMSTDDLKNQMNTDSDLMVINVLPEKYYNDCHITGSINAPLPDLVEQASSWNRSQKIVVYCALEACDAGEKGYILLHCMGFTNVTDYKGGIKEWYQLNYPTEGPALSDYLHTRWHAALEDTFPLYPETIVCSQQVCWLSRYQK